MICLISPTLNQAQKFAATQNLQSNEWFYGLDAKSLTLRTNFHVLVIAEFPEERLFQFEAIYSLAKRQGSIGRV